jgi:hypothetical protein
VWGGQGPNWAVEPYDDDVVRYINYTHKSNAIVKTCVILREYQGNFSEISEADCPHKYHSNCNVR